jgi:hypothetical protein
MIGAADTFKTSGVPLASAGVDISGDISRFFFLGVTSGRVNAIRESLSSNPGWKQLPPRASSTGGGVHNSDFTLFLRLGFTSESGVGPWVFGVSPGGWGAARSDCFARSFLVFLGLGVGWRAGVVDTVSTSSVTVTRDASPSGGDVNNSGVFPRFLLLGLDLALTLGLGTWVLFTACNSSVGVISGDSPDGGGADNSACFARLFLVGLDLGLGVGGGSGAVNTLSPSWEAVFRDTAPIGGDVDDSGGTTRFLLLDLGLALTLGLGTGVVDTACVSSVGVTSGVSPDGGGVAKSDCFARFFLVGLGLGAR